MMDDNVIPLHLREQVEKPSVAALFQAPEQPGSEQLSAADPLNELDDTQKELVRLRNMPVNEVVLEFLGIRDHLDERRHAWQVEETRLKDKLLMMSMVMREKADTLGVDNFTIRGVGTAYRNVKTSIRVVDWQAYWNWLVETNNSQCVEKRAAKLAVMEVVTAQGGKLPPGLDKIEEVEFTVRRLKA
jgi:hypothetical protein